MVLQNAALERDTSEHVGTEMEQLRQDCRWPDIRTAEQTLPENILNGEISYDNQDSSLR